MREPASMDRQVHALVEGWTEAFNAGRIDDLLALYAPDARVVPPGRTVLKGRESARGYFWDIRAQGFRDYAVAIDEIHAKGEAQIASGRWALSGPGGDGARHRYEGNWLNVLARTGETWCIAVHMWN